jgi:hypothetical protein
MGQYQYRASTKQDEDGSVTITSRKGRRLWMEPDLPDAEWKRLGADLAREIQDALVARDAMIGEGQTFDYYDWLYEQGRTPKDEQKPWGADLNSYLPCEAVDSFSARIYDAAFPKQEVVCAVGGWGEASKQKAPLVEEFLDFTFRQEEPDAQLSVAMTFFQSLLEDAGILEVTEGYEVRANVEEIDIVPETDESGALILNERNRPIPKMDPTTGEPVKQTDPNGHAITAKYRSLKPRLTGPQYDVISCRDFVFLPGHAKNRKGVWGYAVRCWIRVPELKEQALAGIYREDKVHELGTQTDRQTTQSMDARGQDVAPQDEHTAEKECWRVCFKRDLDGDGFEEWYTATVSTQHDVMIRLVLDDFKRSRCLAAIPFPRRDSVYGYSFMSKIASIAEEHAALRNMAADRSALATNPPIQKIDGGLWDPEAEPWGTGQTITVRDHREVEAMQVPDVPASNVELRRECLGAKERLTGLSDPGSSVSGTTPATATRDNIIAQAGNIRLNSALNFLREFIAELWEIRRLIYIRKLESEQDGEEMAHGLADRMAYRGVEAADRITADDLKGRFYYKPVGSVASADPARRRMESAQALMGLGNFAQMNPMIGMALQTPEAALAIMMTWARDNDVVDKQAFIAPLRKMIQAKAQQEQMMQQMDPLSALMGGGAPPQQAPMGGNVEMPDGEQMQEQGY